MLQPTLPFWHVLPDRRFQFQFWRDGKNKSADAIQNQLFSMYRKEPESLHAGLRTVNCCSVWHSCEIRSKKERADSIQNQLFSTRRKGLEPLTYWFVASHSIQLSYRRIHPIGYSNILPHLFGKCKPYFKIFFKKFVFFRKKIPRTLCTRD